MKSRLECHHVRRFLQAFLDGEVAPSRAELVAAHLESCSRCRIEGETLQRVIAALRHLRPDLDLAAYTRLVAVVPRHRSRRRPGRRGSSVVPGPCGSEPSCWLG